MAGRFLSLDPVFQAGNPLAVGGYDYAGNDPVSSADPSGLTLELAGGGSSTCTSDPSAAGCNGSGSGGSGGSGSTGSGYGGGSTGGGSAGGGPDGVGRPASRGGGCGFLGLTCVGHFIKDKPSLDETWPV